MKTITISTTKAKYRSNVTFNSTCNCGSCNCNCGAQRVNNEIYNDLNKKMKQIVSDK